MTEKTLGVSGMTCGHCAQTVQKAVGALTGVRRVTVDLEKQAVTVDYDEGKIDGQAIAAKIMEAGFELK